MPATSTAPGTTALSLSLVHPACDSVSVLLMAPPASRAAFVLAHGAGAGMTHAFMEQLARGLADTKAAWIDALGAR